MPEQSRHDPEFSDAVDRIFGVRVTRPSEAPDGFDLDQFEDDIAVVSRAALTPAALHVENARLRAALREIAALPDVLRNPDGDDQAAATMKLIAADTLNGLEDER